jgi:hypothetical protein
MHSEWHSGPARDRWRSAAVIIYQHVDRQSFSPPERKKQLATASNSRPGYLFCPICTATWLLVAWFIGFTHLHTDNDYPTGPHFKVKTVFQFNRSSSIRQRNETMNTSVGHGPLSGNIGILTVQSNHASMEYFRMFSIHGILSIQKMLIL